MEIGIEIHVLVLGIEMFCLVLELGMFFLVLEHGILVWFSHTKRQGNGWFVDVLAGNHQRLDPQ